MGMSSLDDEIGRAWLLALGQRRTPLENTKRGKCPPPPLRLEDFPPDTREVVVSGYRYFEIPSGEIFALARALSPASGYEIRLPWDRRGRRIAAEVFDFIRENGPGVDCRIGPTACSWPWR